MATSNKHASSTLRTLNFLFIFIILGGFILHLLGLLLHLADLPGGDLPLGLVGGIFIVIGFPGAIVTIFGEFIENRRARSGGGDG